MSTDKLIRLSNLGMTHVRVPILGRTELIMDRWTKQAMKQVLDAQQGKLKELPPRDPGAEYLNSIYRNHSGQAIIPAKNIKACLTDAARTFPDQKDVNMTLLRQIIRVDTDALVEGEHHMREDPVRLQGKGRPWSIAFRACFPEWRTVFDFSFAGIRISEELVINIVEAAGMVGIGSWRPGKSNSGWAGTFNIDQEKLNNGNF